MNFLAVVYYIFDVVQLLGASFLLLFQIELGNLQSSFISFLGIRCSLEYLLFEIVVNINTY